MWLPVREDLRVRTVREEERLSLLNLEADLLQDLPSDRLVESLSGLDSAAGQTPLAGKHSPVPGHPAEQVLASAVLHHADDDEASGGPLGCAGHAWSPLRRRHPSGRWLPPLGLVQQEPRQECGGFLIGAPRRPHLPTEIVDSLP